MAAPTAAPAAPASSPASVRLVADAAGRARFACTALRGSTALAVAVEDALDRLPGVRQVYAYPRTGSVVVWYDTNRTEPGDLARTIEGGLRTKNVGNRDLNIAVGNEREREDGGVHRRCQRCD